MLGDQLQWCAEEECDVRLCCAMCLGPADASCGPAALLPSTTLRLVDADQAKPKTTSHCRCGAQASTMM